jgi:hypothetical protein
MRLSAGVLQRFFKGNAERKIATSSLMRAGVPADRVASHALEACDFPLRPGQVLYLPLRDFGPTLLSADGRYAICSQAARISSRGRHLSPGASWATFRLQLTAGEGVRRPVSGRHPARVAFRGLMPHI